MSDGSFTNTFYEDADGEKRTITVQPETITTWNPAATGPKTRDRVRVSGGNSQIGRKARSVSLVRLVGPVTEGVQARKTTVIPVLTVAAFDAITESSTLDYNGETWTVAGKNAEAGRF